MRNLTIAMTEKLETKDAGKWSTDYRYSKIVTPEQHKNYTTKNTRDFFRSLGGVEWFKSEPTPVGVEIIKSISTNPEKTKKVTRLFKFMVVDCSDGDLLNVVDECLNEYDLDNAAALLLLLDRENGLNDEADYIVPDGTNGHYCDDGSKYYIQGENPGAMVKLGRYALTKERLQQYKIFLVTMLVQ